jgi:putative ABC transport system permease protein
MNAFRLREHGASILVSALAGAFGVALLQVTGALAQAISADDVTGSSTTVAVMLTIVAGVFIAIATYVGGIVTANTFATIIAGRTRTIALRRLIGSTAAAERRRVASEGLMVGLIGAVIGAVTGTAFAAALVSIGVALGQVPDLPYTFLSPVLVIPVVTVVLTTWLASWVGSRRVLTVSPIQATGAAQERSVDELGRHRVRTGISLTLFVIGTALLVVGMLVGLVSPLGVLIGVIGGILSFTGVAMGATIIMPPALRLVGRMLGSTPSARLAAENAVRYPERSSRMTIGMVIAVSLVTMFIVAVESFQHIIDLARAAQPETYAGTEETLGMTVAVFSILVGFSAVIAAVGMVNTLSLSVLQRTRELGLLRALGFTARQLRSMIRVEALQLSAAALLVGLVLGIGYGWAGAQSLLGSAAGVPGLVLPVVPIWLLVAVAAAAAVLTVVASVAPSRRATRIVPVEALAME